MTRMLLTLLLTASVCMFGCGEKPAEGPSGQESGPKEAPGPSSPDSSISATPEKQPEMRRLDQPSPGPKTVGVSLLTMEHNFYQELRRGLEEKAKEHNYKLLVVSGDMDPAKQANQIDNFIVQDVDAMVICPCDSRSVGGSIAEANKADTPVFTADIANLSTKGFVVSHIASDNYQGGVVAGELMVRALSEKQGMAEGDVSGSLVVINHPAVTSVLERVAGFRDVIDEYPNLKIVADVPAWGQRARAMAVTEDILQSVPQIDGVFGINDDSALGALAAIEAADRLDQIVIIGYDATPEARKAISDGKIYGDTIQYPHLIGTTTIETIRSYFAGEPVPAVIPIETGAWTAESAE